MSKSHGTRDSARPQRFWHVVPDGALRRFKAKREQYIAEDRAAQVTYPDPSKLRLLTPEQVLELGFVEHELQDSFGLEPLGSRHRRRHHGRRHGQPQGKGQQQDHGQPRDHGQSQGDRQPSGKTLPDPSVVENIVSGMLTSAGLKPRGVPSGDVVAVELNCENCNISKAKFFGPAFKAIFECADVVYLEEVTCEAVQYFATITGYIGHCSKQNSRGQAVGFLVNPARFEIIGPVEEWSEVAQIQGIQDLRPIVALKTKDKLTGGMQRRGVGHLKSLRGGERHAGAIQYQQYQKIAVRMGMPVTGCKPQLGQLRIVQFFKNLQLGRNLTDHAANFWIERQPVGVQCVDGMWVLAGDFNNFMGQVTQVYEPLTRLGYLLLYPHDRTSTQSMGGRLDGVFRDVSTGTTCTSESGGPFAQGTTDDPTVVR
jgi:hypothetical protein